MKLPTLPANASYYELLGMLSGGTLTALSILKVPAYLGLTVEELGQLVGVGFMFIAAFRMWRDSKKVAA